MRKRKYAEKLSEAGKAEATIRQSRMLKGDY